VVSPGGLARRVVPASIFHSLPKHPLWAFASFRSFGLLTSQQPRVPPIDLGSSLFGALDITYISLASGVLALLALYLCHI